MKEKIEDVKKRWPFHSVQTALYRELEELETELEELRKEKGCRFFALWFSNTFFAMNNSGKLARIKLPMGTLGRRAMTIKKSQGLTI